MKKIISKGILFLSILFFIACNDNNNSTPITYGDAFILSEISSSGDSEGNVVYSLMINAYSTNYTINSVNVSGNYFFSNYTLTNNNGLFSYKEGPSDDYNAFSDIYTFNYTFASTTATSSSNTVTSNVIQPAEITSCIGNSSSIVIKWNTIEDANALLIQLKNSEGVVIFSNNNYYNLLDETEYTISNETGLWEDGYSLTEGETYTVEILGFLTESSISSYIQAESLASASVIWE